MNTLKKINYTNSKLFFITLLTTILGFTSLFAQEKGLVIKQVAGDCENGEALVIYTNGDRYDGWFKDSLYNGLGYLKKKDKTIYDGEFINGKYGGWGYLQYPNKDVYEGNFSNGLYEGNGTLTEYKGRIYNGEFKAGKMHGKGSIVLANGDKYTGSFRDGEIDGLGEFYSQGYLISGLFEKGKLIDGRIINLDTNEVSIVKPPKKESAAHRKK